MFLRFSMLSGVFIDVFWCKFIDLHTQAMHSSPYPLYCGTFGCSTPSTSIIGRDVPHLWRIQYVYLYCPSMNVYQSKGVALSGTFYPPDLARGIQHLPHSGGAHRLVHLAQNPPEAIGIITCSHYRFFTNRVIA